jgi:hypothetical protein
MTNEHQNPTHRPKQHILKPYQCQQSDRLTPGHSRSPRGSRAYWLKTRLIEQFPSLEPEPLGVRSEFGISPSMAWRCRG